MTSATRTHFHTVIVGGGPAGLAPLVSASRNGLLDDLLANGVAVVERGAAIGAGSIGRYGITSDSTAETFLTAVVGHRDPRLGVLADGAIGRTLAAQKRDAVPLSQAGELMAGVGAVLSQAITDAGGAVLNGHEAVAARRTRDGRWHVRLHRLLDGASRDVTADAVLVATGGEQTRSRLIWAMQTRLCWPMRSSSPWGSRPRGGAWRRFRHPVWRSSAAAPAPWPPRPYCCAHAATC